MTHMQKPAPPHGGLKRIQFDGAAGSGKQELGFNAASVNVDNWSPYWIKLEPVEEFIPPFQHDVTISLPLIHSYEFRTIAPPGLDQADIVASTGIPGNSFPVICVFSSVATNNDAGFNALDNAANIATNAVNGTNKVNGVNQDPYILQTIDVTNYNGIYFYLYAQGLFDVLFEYDNVNTGAFTGFYQRSFYSHEQMLFTIPKLSKHIRISIISIRPAGSQTNFIWAIRPFLGAATFEAQQLTDPANPSVITPISGDVVTLAGNQTTIFPCFGIDNAVVSFIAFGGTPLAGVYARVYITQYGFANPAIRLLVATAAWSFGDGTQTKVIPLFGLLQSQAYRIEVEVGSTSPGSISTAVAFHHAKDIALPTANEPLPFVFGGTAIIAPGAPVLVTAIPVFGVLSHFELLATSISATVGAINSTIIGSAVAAQVVIGYAPASIISRQSFLDNDKGIIISSGFNSLWFQTTSAAATNVAYLGFVR